MRARRLRTLAVRDLDLLGGRCTSCSELLDGDRAWATAAVERFGLCGVMLVDADRPQGWLLVSPALNLPVGHPLASAAARSSDAAQLLAAHLPPGDEGVGTGRQLVQHVAARLVDQVGAIDALGGSLGNSCTLPPAALLQQVGFVPLVDAVPRADAAVALRLDLTRSIRWRPLVDQARDVVTGWIRTAAWPEPSTRAGATERSH